MEKIDDNYILNKCSKSGGLFNPYSVNDDIKNYLKNRYSDIPETLFSYNEVFYRIKNNIISRPVCIICGKPVKFIVNKYSCTCSDKCYKENIANKTKLRWNEMPDSKKQIIKEKLKQTCLQKYGVEYSFLSENNKIKADITREKKYGNKNYGKFGSNSFKKKMKDKYGVEYPLSNITVRLKISKALSSKETLDKMKNTCLNRYGVECISLSPEIQDKIIESYKKHGTFNTSKEEELLYNILLNIFNDNDIIRNYKSDIYPFKCDFYIKSLNLYIEYQGSMYHNFHLFNSKKDKQLLLEILKKTSANNEKNRYDALIETWTVRDINKWEISIINNINMLFIYPNFHKLWLYYKTHEDNKEIFNDIVNYLKNVIYNNYSYNNDNKSKLLKIGENI